MFKFVITTLVASLLGGVTADTFGSSIQDAGPFVNQTWYSGLVTIDHSNYTHGEFANNRSDDIFYWWFESENDTKADPLVLWLTGGPGCASEIALFYENGPYAFNKDGTTLHGNPNTWNSFANLLYVDQPIGTGFSHSSVEDLDTNEDEVAENMAQFLIKFLDKYPQLQGKDFYITGESYAGHYIPAIAHSYVFKHKADIKLNFKGMAIGNGLVSPYLQYPAYETFALENNLIGPDEGAILKAAFEGCQVLIKSGIWPVALEFCQIAVEIILGNPLAPRFNVYDIREKCEKPPLCYDFSPADHLLKTADIQKVLGVDGRKWTECSQVVHTALLGDWMLDLSAKVTDLLNDGLDVLVYSGDKDFICNWRGGEAWTHEVDWSGKASFQAANYTQWKGTNSTTGVEEEWGQLKSFQNLKFLRVENAGHMVPMNKPESALLMLKQFVQGGPLREQPQEEKPEQTLEFNQDLIEAFFQQ